MYQQPQRSWWSRNWKWVVPTVPVSFLGVVVTIGGLMLLLMLAVSGIKTMTHSSDAYEQVMTQAQTHPELMGQPIEAGLWGIGEVNTNGAS